MTDSGLTQNNSANGFALYLNTEAVSALCARSSVRQYLKVMLIKLLIFSLDQPSAFLFLSSSRALPVISISLSGYPSLKHSNIASVAICLYFLLTLIRYWRAVWPLTKYIVDNYSSIILHSKCFLQKKYTNCFEITNF